MTIKHTLHTTFNKLRSYTFMRHSKWVPIGAGVLVTLFVFSLGVEVGNGRLSTAAFSHSATSKNSNLPTQLDYASVTKLYDTLRQNYNGKLTSVQLIDGLKSGLAQSTKDPYTEYFTASEAKTFNNELNNSFSGIGAELGHDADSNLIVVSPIKGFPADKAGLKAQDIITAINGESTTDLAPDIAASKIRGQQGTSVVLKVIRNKTQELTFTIKRDNIQLPSVTSKILNNNVGYIQISSFADDTVSLAQNAAQQFAQAKVSGVILDLRGNPGGLLDAAVGVSSLWLPQGQTVVSEKGTIGSQTYTATGNSLLHGVRTVVLIDGGSASASEITAGALHDNGAAHLIGVQSFGKGVVQQLIHFNDGSELKVTVASWYRPNGENIQKKGITPDQVVTSGNTDANVSADVQLNAAEMFLSQ